MRQTQHERCHIRGNAEEPLKLLHALDNALIASTLSGSGLTASAVYTNPKNGISFVLMMHFPELNTSPFPS